MSQDQQQLKALKIDHILYLSNKKFEDLEMDFETTWIQLEGSRPELEMD